MDVKPDGIPSELREQEQWVNWTSEERDGKLTKVPRTASGDFAKTDDPETWGTFGECFSKGMSNGLDGIGFVFSDNDPYIGIDLDDCRDPESGDVEEWALDVIQQLDSFTEISPSGTGFHVIVKGEYLPDKNRKGDIEMYDTSRFFTMTGEVVDVSGEPIEDGDPIPSPQERTDEIVEVADEYLEDESEEDDVVEVTLDEIDVEVDVDIDPDENSGPLPPEDQELVEEKKSYFKFFKLWNGEWNHSKLGYPSQSEADIAMCNLLAKYTDGDPQRMDRLYRASGLMRDKWDSKRYADGSTYGEKHIRKGIRWYHSNSEDEDAEIGENSNETSGGGAEADLEDESGGNEQSDSDPADEADRVEGEEERSDDSDPVAANGWGMSLEQDEQGDLDRPDQQDEQDKFGDRNGQDNSDDKLSESVGNTESTMDLNSDSVEADDQEVSRSGDRTKGFDLGVGVGDPGDTDGTNVGDGADTPVDGDDRQSSPLGGGSSENDTGLDMDVSVDVTPETDDDVFEDSSGPDGFGDDSAQDSSVEDRQDQGISTVSERLNELAYKIAEIDGELESAENKLVNEIDMEKARLDDVASDLRTLSGDVRALEGKIESLETLLASLAAALEDHKAESVTRVCRDGIPDDPNSLPASVQFEAEANGEDTEPDEQESGWAPDWL